MNSLFYFKKKITSCISIRLKSPYLFSLNELSPPFYYL
jgi:hypothetical protein